MMPRRSVLHGLLAVAGLATAVLALGMLLTGETRAVEATAASAPAPTVAPGVAPASAASLAELESPAPSASAAPAEKQKRIYTVATIGDSLTDEASYKHAYVAQLRAACPKSRFDNYGRGGDMVNQMRRRFRRDVLGDGTGKRPQYTHLIIYGGVNDLYSDLTAGRTPKKVGRDLTKMYRWGREAGMQIVALTVSPWGGFKKYYNARRGKATLVLNRWIVEQLDAGAVDHVLDTYPLLSCGDDTERLCPKYAKPFKDGIHFGKLGHQKLTEQLLASVFPDCG